MFLTDSHCHLHLLDLGAEPGGIEAVISRAREHGIGYILNVCVDVSELPTVLSFAENYPFIGASVGQHPNHQDEEINHDQLVKLAQHKKIIAIGETGLDYYRSSGDMAWQVERFREHIRAAKTTRKPLIIHTRQAQQDTLRVMREENASEIGGVMHCFTEDWEIAKQALDMNFYISLSGIVTFRNATTVQEVAKHVPLDRLLIETDAPYLAPAPHRGKQNEPGFVRLTAEFLANLRGVTLMTLAQQTTDNFFTLFTGAERPYV